jgi:hypothetical protein
MKASTAVHAANEPNATATLIDAQKQTVVNATDVEVSLVNRLRATTHLR